MREADIQPAAHRDHARGRRSRESARIVSWPVAPACADPADRLAQEVAGAPAGVGAALAQAGHEHVTRARGDREQRVVAADMGVAVVEGALLLEPVGLADGRVEVDRQGPVAGTRTRRPGPRRAAPG